MNDSTLNLVGELPQTISRAHALIDKIADARKAISDSFGADIDADAEAENARYAVLAVDRARFAADNLIAAIDAVRETVGDFAGDLADPLAPCADHAAAVVGHLHRVSQLVNHYGSEVFSELDLAKVLSHTLAAELASAAELALDPDSVPGRPRRRSAEGAKRRGRRVSPSAGRLVMAAAAMLPEADRNCYAEEFRGELRDLAEAGAGRAGQLAYAARQLRSAWGLRAALDAPVRRRVVP